jgi:hypothetical protein
MPSKSLLFVLSLSLTVLSCLRQAPSGPSGGEASTSQPPATTVMAETPPPAPPAGGGGSGEQSNLVPDPKEPREAIERYWEARRLATEGKWDQARQLLEKATREFPDSRHLHQEYADLLWHLSKGTDQDLMKQSAREAVRALELLLQARRMDYSLTDRAATTLGRTGDKETLDRIFTEILKQDSSATIHLDYAKGLALLKDPRAAAELKEAARLDPNGDATVRYAEWLLDQGRDREALEALPASSPLYYVHFLRGFAFERLHQPDEARLSYGRYTTYGLTQPAPARFRIAGSRLQAEAGIRFEKETQGR